MSDPAITLEGLYRAVGPGLLAYLRRGVRDAHAAEDLLHETFCRAACQPQGLRTAGSPRAWLYAIARNLAITAWRRRRPSIPLADDVAEPIAAADPRLEEVSRALRELPPPYRETLELRLREELTYEELAHVLGVPIGTIRSRLHEALRRVRAAVAAREQS